MTGEPLRRLDERAPTEQHPEGWRPGWTTTRRAGYSLAEARAAVGPGWASLVEQAWHACHASGLTVGQVKEKCGTLRIYAHDAEARLVRGPDDLHRLERLSTTICEACGAPGRHYAVGEVLAFGATEVRVGWSKTLCPAHAEEYYGGGQSSWDPAAARS